MSLQDHFKRINGTSIQLFESHVAEIMWRNQNRKNYIPNYFNLIKKAYLLTQEPRKDLIPVPLFDSWEITSTAEYQELFDPASWGRRRIPSHRRRSAKRPEQRHAPRGWVELHPATSQGLPTWSHGITPLYTSTDGTMTTISPLL